MKNLLIILLSLTAISATAQTDSSKITFEDNEFFYQAIEEYRGWLTVTGFDTIVTATDFVIAVEHDVVVLDLTVTNQRDWLSLCKTYQAKTGGNLREVLFYRMLFTFQVNNKQGGIRLRSSAVDHFMDMRVVNGELKIQESDPKSIPVLLFFPFHQISGYGVIESSSSVEHTQKLLKQFFKSKYNTKDYPDVVLRMDEYNNNHLTIVIRNMQDEVLAEAYNSYYEWLTIEAEVSKENGKVYVKYNMMGKYSYRMFNRRMTSYYKMNETKTSYLWDYNSRLRNEIDKYIRD